MVAKAFDDLELNLGHFCCKSRQLPVVPGTRYCTRGTVQLLLTWNNVLPVAKYRNREVLVLCYATIRKIVKRFQFRNSFMSIQNVSSDHRIIN